MKTLISMCTSAEHLLALILRLTWSVPSDYCSHTRVCD